MSEHIYRAEAKEIAREVAREEFKLMQSEIKEVMREVMEEKLGKGYTEEREFIKSWMKKTNSFSTGVWGTIGKTVVIFFLSAMGALALIKMGFIPTK